MSTTSRRIGRSIAAGGIVTLVASLLSCGIPELAYLAPPILDDVDTYGIVRFDHDSANDVDSFSGYDLYYKFYSDESATSEFSTDKTYIEASSPSSVITRLASKGYRRITNTDSANPPTIPVDAATRAADVRITVQIQFSETSTQQAAVTSPAILTTELLRDADIYNLADEKGFSAMDIIPGVDEDVPSTTNPTTINLGITIVATGINFETFNRIYSTAVVAADTANGPLEIFHQ